MANPAHRNIKPATEVLEKYLRCLGWKGEYGDHERRNIKRWQGELVRTAYHEAGHAVAAVLLFDDETVEWAEIATGEADRTGFVSHRDLLLLRHEPEDWQQRQVAALGTLYYAGVAAGFPKPRMPDARFEDILHSCAGDREQFQKAAHELGRSRPAERWHKASWNRARRLVFKHWPAVDAIAESLLLRGWTGGEEIEEIVKRSPLTLK